MREFHAVVDVEISVDLVNQPRLDRLPLAAKLAQAFNVYRYAEPLHARDGFHVITALDRLRYVSRTDQLPVKAWQRQHVRLTVVQESSRLFARPRTTTHGNLSTAIFVGLTAIIDMQVSTHGQQPAVLELSAALYVVFVIQVLDMRVNHVFRERPVEG